MTNIDSDAALERYQKGIIDYYSEAGMDYEPWSSQFNMHFGYYRCGVNPFSREAMLQEMNAQIIHRLQLPDKPHTLVDLGCGVGATARYSLHHNPHTHVHGITIVPWQIQQANSLTPKALLDERITFSLQDYTSTNFEDNSIDGAYAIESSCYAQGTDKQALLSETFRHLKPGGRMVIADGFRRTPNGSAYGLFEYAYQKVCEGWYLDTFANIDDFTAAMSAVGFVDIVVEPSSWQVAPSVCHVPWVSLKYFFSSIFSKSGDRTLQKRHFMAPVMGMFVGLHQQHYQYYIVHASKPKR